WNTTSKTYTLTSDPYAANGVLVQGHRIKARGTAIPLVFAKLIGVNTCDINASAIAMVVAGQSKTFTVQGTSNPFLSGMPPGSVASLNNPHNSPDYAGNGSDPKQSPIKATLPITPGLAMTFDGINGG